MKNILFPLDSRISIQLQDGSIIKGVVKSPQNASTQFIQTEEKEYSIDDSFFSNITNLSWLPAPEVIEEKEQTRVRKNGKIKYFRNNEGSMLFSEGKRIFSVDFSERDLDDELYKQVQNEGEDSICEIDIFCSKPYLNENHKWETRYIMALDTLDNILDKVSMLAEEGYIKDALEIIESLRDQFEGDQDIESIFAQLSAASNESRSIDLLKPFLEYEIPAQGRIKSLSNKSGIIIDIQSHRELFFSYSNVVDNNLWEEINDQNPIGNPVIYFPIKNKYGSMEARCVLSSMPTDEILECAESLDVMQSLNAWGISQIVLHNIPDNERALKIAQDKWKNEYVRNNAWSFLEQTPYNGEQKELIVSVESEPSPVYIERYTTHDSILKKIKNPAEIGRFPKLEVDFASHVTYEQSKTIDSVTRTINETFTKKEDTSFLLVNGDTEKKEKPQTPIIIGGKTARGSGDLASTISKLGLDAFSQDNIEEEKGDMLSPVCTILYRRGNTCWIDAETGNNDDNLKFSIYDIVDLELLEVATSEYRTDRFLQGVPIVCQFDKKKKRAWSVFRPCTCRKALELADKCLQQGIERKLDENYQDSLAYFEKAKGVVDCILAQYDGYEANDFLIIIKDRIKEVQTIIESTKDNAILTDEQLGYLRRGTIKIAITSDEDGEKRPGIIHDDLSQRDITFISSSIVDDPIKATKNRAVMYTIIEKDGNAVAWCIHQADTIENFIVLAEKLYKLNYPLEAWGIVEQILQYDPDNQEALALQEKYEVHPIVRKNTIKRISLYSPEANHNNSYIEATKLYKEGLLEDAIAKAKESIVDYDNVAENNQRNDIDSNSKHRWAIKGKEESIRTIDSYYRKWLEKASNQEERNLIVKAYTDFAKDYYDQLDQRSYQNLYLLANYYNFITDEENQIRMLDKLVSAYSRSKSVKNVRLKEETLSLIA